MNPVGRLAGRAVDLSVGLLICNLIGGSVIRAVGLSM